MSFFYLIGVYAFLWWFIDNFKSLFQIVWNLFLSSLQLNSNQPLNEKFGIWAGKLEEFRLIVTLFECLYQEIHSNWKSLSNKSSGAFPLKNRIDCVLISVVTGSTDGIGREYAKQLAQHGVNVVLIARNEAKLIQVSREIGESIKRNN